MMKNLLVLGILGILAVQTNAQNENKDRLIKFIIVDDDRFPDLATTNGRDDRGSCEIIKSWVESNRMRYFQLLQSNDSVLTINIDSLSSFPLQNQKNFQLAFEKLKPSIQCQRFQFVFYKIEETNIHHEKVVRHFFYLVSKNDFLYLKKVMKDNLSHD